MKANITTMAIEAGWAEYTGKIRCSFGGCRLKFYRTVNDTIEIIAINTGNWQVLTIVEHPLYGNTALVRERCKPNTIRRLFRNPRTHLPHKNRVNFEVLKSNSRGER